MLGFVVLIENCGHKWGINNEPETNEYLQTRQTTNIFVGFIFTKKYLTKIVFLLKQAQ